MNPLIFTGIPVGLAFGFVLSRGRFCMNSAFRDIIVLKEYATCAIEMGSQLWMIMRVNDDLVEYGSDAGDVPQVIRESMFGVIIRCRGARLDDQLSLMVDHLRTGMLQFERLTERLGVVFKAKQKDQPNTPTLSEGHAIEILSQLDGDRPNA